MQVLVPALGHQQRERDVVLTEVGQGGAAQVVQAPGPGGGDEDLLGAAVVRAGQTGPWAEILGRWRPAPARSATPCVWLT